MSYQYYVLLLLYVPNCIPSNYGRGCILLEIWSNNTCGVDLGFSHAASVTSRVRTGVTSWGF